MRLVLWCICDPDHWRTVIYFYLKKLEVEISKKKSKRKNSNPTVIDRQAKLPQKGAAFPVVTNWISSGKLAHQNWPFTNDVKSILITGKQIPDNRGKRRTNKKKSGNVNIWPPGINAGLNLAALTSGAITQTGENEEEASGNVRKIDIHGRASSLSRKSCAAWSGRKSSRGNVE